jgi:phosphohistidine phosphatase
MTVRSLVLLRHAKADTPPGTADEQRPLSARGHADAQAAGAWLGSRHVPELVLCSPTKRTRQTWHAVAANLPAKADPVVRYERRVYQGGADELLELVRETEDSVASVLVIGHNPTLSQLAFELDPEGGLDSDGLRTCGLSVHSFEGAWRDCGPRRAAITATHTARGD